jgi:hypothetical protein
MFKSIIRFTSSFAALLLEKGTSGDAEGQLEKIRNAMLDELLNVDDSLGVLYGAVWTAIDGARDIQSLWYLRSDLLVLISESHGEKFAWGKLGEITELFRGYIANTQFSRKPKRSI